MVKKRARMVDESDEQWTRFWAAYPHRVAKKEARKAWVELNPSPALVDRIIAALEWQVEEWARKADWYTPPHPASWLRSERFNDEQPQAARMKTDMRGHYPPCKTNHECIAKAIDEHKKAAAS